MFNDIIPINAHLFLDEVFADEEMRAQHHSPNPLQFGDAGGFDYSSIFTADQQRDVNKFMISYQNTISHSSLFEKLKKYEIEFNQPSSKFYEEWRDGRFAIDPKTSEWASIYRLIYGND